MSRHTVDVMGTVFSLDLRNDVEASVLDDVDRDLRYVDAVFSTYRDDSAISRLARGDVRLADCPPEVSEVLEGCSRAAQATDNWFSATAGGRLDPSGYVKGWAIGRVDDILRAAGSTRHAIGGGGDVLLGEEPGAGEPWNVGIVDPTDRTRVIATVSGSLMAVATSGVAERGAHVLDPFTGRPATGLRSATVVGPDIVMADVYATATLAMGASAAAWLEQVAGYEGLFVTDGGDVTRTSGWR